MDISKAVAASVRGLGLKTKPKSRGVDPAMLEPPPEVLSPEEARAQQANLELLNAAKATLTRTIELLR